MQAKNLDNSKPSVKNVPTAEHLRYRNYRCKKLIFCFRCVF